MQVGGHGRGLQEGGGGVTCPADLRREPECSGRGYPVKGSRTLWGLPRTDLPTMSSSCLMQKNFSQRRNLIREVRKCRSKEKQSNGTKQ